MEQIADDPIIRCIERTGYPPWYGRDDDEEWEDSEDVYYGSETGDF